MSAQNSHLVNLPAANSVSAALSPFPMVGRRKLVTLLNTAGIKRVILNHLWRKSQLSISISKLNVIIPLSLFVFDKIYRVTPYI